MTRAAELTTSDATLQTLFEADWASKKYRRAKTSKADFYAGWLLAYERFHGTAPTIEKLTVVASTHVPVSSPAPARKTAARKTRTVEPKIDYVTSCEPCDGRYAPACAKDHDMHEKTCIGGHFTDNGSHSWVKHRAVSGPLRPGEMLHLYKRGCACDDDHQVYRTYYQGGLPLAHSAPKGPAPFDGHESGWKQAIPDSLIRKLAIKAGRPEIAP
jgi:hypothetical protein